MGIVRTIWTFFRSLLRPSPQRGATSKQSSGILDVEVAVSRISPPIEVVATESKTEAVSEVAEEQEGSADPVAEDAMEIEAAAEENSTETSEVVVAETAPQVVEEESIAEASYEVETLKAEAENSRVSTAPLDEDQDMLLNSSPDDAVPAAGAIVEEEFSVVPEGEPVDDVSAGPKPETIAEVKAILEALDEAVAEAADAHTVVVEAMTPAESSIEADLETVELAVEETKPEARTEEAEAVESVEQVEAVAALTESAEDLVQQEPVDAETEPVESAAPVVAAEQDLVAEPVAGPESPSMKTEPEPEPTPTLAAAPIREKTEAEQKTAARVAAAIKAREESADPSPFSIFVGQVYDGPLDLLLDLIRKQDIDIYDIPIAKITAQFLAYVNQLKASDMDVAGEFIYTASLLIHIKSKMLLPRTTLGPDDAAEDPRRELVERLLEHERFKNAAQMLQQKQMLEAATWTNPGVREFREDAGDGSDFAPEIAADTVDLVRIFRDILERARNRPIINVEEDSVTVGQMIQFQARRLTMEDKPVALRKLLSHTRSERALIAMFLALLELVRLQAILLRQDRQFSEIFVKKNSGFEAAMDQGLASARDDWR